MNTWESKVCITDNSPFVIYLCTPDCLPFLWGSDYPDEYSEVEIKLVKIDSGELFSAPMQFIRCEQYPTKC